MKFPRNIKNCMNIKNQKKKLIRKVAKYLNNTKSSLIICRILKFNLKLSLFKLKKFMLTEN
jgi:hypothetical protein